MLSLQSLVFKQHNLFASGRAELGVRTRRHLLCSCDKSGKCRRRFDRPWRETTSANDKAFALNGLRRSGWEMEAGRRRLRVYISNVFLLRWLWSHSHSAHKASIVRCLRVVTHVISAVNLSIKWLIRIYLFGKASSCTMADCGKFSRSIYTKISIFSFVHI